jgi:pimeloyl-ACP methyl ester carboxylesterase
MIESTPSTAESSWVPRGQFFGGTHYVLQEPPKDGERRGKILFIHGIGSYHSGFNRLACYANDQGYQTLQYDLIGRGFSHPSANGQYGEEEHVQQIVELLLHLYGPEPAEKIHVVAHSMGGSLGTIFTSRHTSLVKSLTLLAPAGMMGYFPIGFVRSATCIHGVLKDSLRDVKKQEKIWAQEYLRKGEQYDQLKAETVRDMSIMYANEKDKWIDAFVGCVLAFPMSDISAHIRKIANQEHFPVLLLWGRQDKSVPYSNKRKWTKLLKATKCDFTYKSYNQAGHVFFHECHEEVQPEILNFITAH